MKIIFDFDHTLFSTKRFYFFMKKIFREAGIDERLFQETFEKSKGKGILYNRKRQFNLIIRNRPEINLEFLQKKSEKALKETNRFLYPDVLPALENFKKEYNLYLLSYGKDKFQEDKIEKSKIKKYFKEIYITRDINKTSVLERFLEKKEKALFVDDNPEALSKIKKKFPKIITVRISRGKGKYKNYPDNPEIDFSVKTLKELEKILLGLTPTP